MEVTNNDIGDMIKIIDVCSARGAFRGEELAGVGTLRNKMAAYLQSLEPTEATPAEAEVIS
jgi:hypothetical protein